MSRPPEHENGTYETNAANDAAGAYGVHGAHRAGDVPQVLPNVYHPQPESTPVYDEYADPAAAHGWENTYDETAELPRVAGGVGGAVAGRGHRRSRRKPSPWRSRRVAVAAGAVGVVSVAALVAGFAFSGESPDGTQGKPERTAPTAGEPATSADSSGGPASDGSSGGTGLSRTRSPSTSPSPSGSGDGSDDKGGEPSPTPTGTAPATPAPTTDAPGNANGNPGKGQGGTKGPK